MKVYFEGGIGYFAERRPMSADNASLFVGMKGTLTVINARGVHRFPTEDGTVTIPSGALAEGENRLLFRKEKVLYHIEGLLREGKRITPAGVDAAALLALRHERLAGMEEKLSLLEERVVRLTELTEGYRIF